MKQEKHYYLKLFIIFLTQLILGLLFLGIFLTDRWIYAWLHPVRIPVTGDLLVQEGISYSNISLMTEDGVQLSAWYTPPENGAVILVAHGYASNRPERVHVMLAHHGYGVLTWDFRAHGGSAGDFTTLGYYEQLDVEAALNYVLAQEDVEHVGAWGGSMGAATVILVAAERAEIEAVVSDSGFTSLGEIFEGSAPYPFMASIMKASSRFHSGVDLTTIRPIDAIGNISPRPVFIVDGWSNPDTSASSPHRLYNAAKEPKQIWVEKGVPHLGMLANDPQQYESKVIGFFDKWLLGK